MKELLTKMIIVGDAEVGKTSLAYQYTSSVFSDQYIQTIGTNFLLKDTTINNCHLTLQIWDTAGQERFHKLMPTYYKGAHAAFVVFSVTDPQSYSNVKKWFDLVRQHAADPFIMIIGNKIDLEADIQISSEEGKALADKLGADYLEVSAKTRTNVDEGFDQIINALIRQHEK